MYTLEYIYNSKCATCSERHGSSSSNYVWLCVGLQDVIRRCMLLSHTRKQKGQQLYLHTHWCVCVCVCVLCSIYAIFILYIFLFVYILHWESEPWFLGALRIRDDDHVQPLLYPSESSPSSLRASKKAINTRPAAVRLRSLYNASRRLCVLVS